MGEDLLILFLDGSNERMALAYQRMPEAVRNDVIWARTAEEGISVLKDYKDRLQVVYFDHDLNEDIHGDSRREDSGMEIVRWLEKQNSSTWNCKFIAHGWNETPNKKMVERLLVAGYAAEYRRFGG